MIRVKEPTPVYQTVVATDKHDNPNWIAGVAPARVLAYHRYPGDRRDVYLVQFEGSGEKYAMPEKALLDALKKAALARLPPNRLARLEHMSPLL